MGIRSIQPEHGIAQEVWLFFWTPVAACLAFVPLIAVNLAQLASLALLPFSKRIYRAYNRKVAEAIWGYWAWSMDHIVGMVIEQEGDAIPNAEDAIVIANHQDMGDILALICYGAKKGRIGDIKWMVKDVLKYVPGIGWGLIFLDCLFLKRNWADDEQRIRATFRRFVDGHVPLWMASFPEGTRLTPAKLAASQAYARKTGLPVLQHVLLPRAKGFAASVFGLREHVKAVYSLTLVYDGPAPTLIQMLRGDVARVRIHVKRTPIEELPRGEEDLTAWLVKDFESKDTLIAGMKPAVL